MDVAAGKTGKNMRKVYAGIFAIEAILEEKITDGFGAYIGYARSVIDASQQFFQYFEGRFNNAAGKVEKAFNKVNSAFEWFGF